MKSRLIKHFFIFVLVFLTACDFTPRIHKRVLDAQKYIGARKYKKAIHEYEKILENNPQIKIRVKMYYQLGELYSSHLNNQKKSLFYFNKITTETSNPLWMVKAEEKKGEINFDYLKNFKECVLIYERLTNFKPKLKRFDFFQYRLGISYLKSGLLNKALKTFTLIQNNDGHVYYSKSFYYTGLVYFEKKDWSKAILIWKEYIKIEKRKDNIVQTKFLMANAYETMERLKKAYDLYYSLLGKYPNTEVIKNRLNAIYERKIARKR